MILLDQTIAQRALCPPTWNLDDFSPVTSPGDRRSRLLPRSPSILPPERKAFHPPGVVATARQTVDRSREAAHDLNAESLRAASKGRAGSLHPLCSVRSNPPEAERSRDWRGCWNYTPPSSLARGTWPTSLEAFPAVWPGRHPPAGNSPRRPLASPFSRTPRWRWRKAAISTGDIGSAKQDFPAPEARGLPVTGRFLTISDFLASRPRSRTGFARLASTRADWFSRAYLDPPSSDLPHVADGACPVGSDLGVF
ncbi:hypothetical protein JHW43_003223 [Diplocarpon mali]|nr:hypothetical protein JHW43_003223 [Diplocarpon mali]